MDIREGGQYRFRYWSRCGILRDATGTVRRILDDKLLLMDVGNRTSRNPDRSRIIDAEEIV
jgi:hypothetical protein